MIGRARATSAVSPPIRPSSLPARAGSDRAADRAFDISCALAAHLAGQRDLSLRRHRAHLDEQLALHVAREQALRAMIDRVDRGGIGDDGDDGARTAPASSARGLRRSSAGPTAICRAPGSSLLRAGDADVQTRELQCTVLDLIQRRDRAIVIEIAAGAPPMFDAADRLVARHDGDAAGRELTLGRLARPAVETPGVFAMRSTTLVEPSFAPAQRRGSVGLDVGAVERVHDRAIAASTACRHPRCRRYGDRVAAFCRLDRLHHRFHRQTTTGAFW